MAATAPATTWEKNYGEASSKDTGASVWQTSDCGFIITGKNGENHLLLMKTDWQGKVLWTKIGADASQGTFVRQTSDGGYIVVGDAGGNMFVLKTDGNGDKVWSTKYPRPNSKTVSMEDIKQTSDDGYIVAGSINMGGKQGSDMYVVRLDKNGNQLWDLSMGGVDGENGNGADYAHSVWQTSDGGYIVGGSDWSSTYWSKAALAKVDEDGKQLWYKIYDTNPEHPVQSDRSDGSSVEVQQTRDGGIIYAGLRSGKMLLLKTDDQGNEQWNQTYVQGQCYSVQQTWDDGYVFTGYPGSSYDKVTVVRADSRGNQLWEKDLTGLGLGRGVSIQQLGNGSYVVAGATKADPKSNDDVYLALIDKDFTPVPNAQLISSMVPLKMEAGGTYTISVMFTNNGTMPWTFQDGTIMAPAGGANGDAALFGIKDNLTVPWGSVIRPGQSMKMDYTVTAPEMNGTYYPEVRMFWENHGFFGQPGRVPVIVVNGTPDTRTPTAKPTAEATTKPTAGPGATSAPTQTPGTTEPTAEPATGGKSGGLPCLGSVILPLLLVGTVTLGLSRRRNK